MTDTPPTLADLLAECDAGGIQLIPAADGSLTVDAPDNALTPELLERLKAHKADLLTILRHAADVPRCDPGDAAAVWKETLKRLEGKSMFPADMLEALGSADVRWVDDKPPCDPATEPTPVVIPKAPAKPVCRCGATNWRDVPIHGGKSIRRDCGRCGRFVDFPVWYGKATPPS